MIESEKQSGARSRLLCYLSLFLFAIFFRKLVDDGKQFFIEVSPRKLNIKFTATKLWFLLFFRCFALRTQSKIIFGLSSSGLFQSMPNSSLSISFLTSQ